MTVYLRSNVLRRDEKGMFGIPFKRLLVAGMGGGISVSLLQNVAGNGVAFAVAAIVVVGALILTASRGGIPAWQRAVYGLQARFMIAAERPTDFLHPLAHLFGISPDQIILDGNQLFGGGNLQELTQPDEWVVYNKPADDVGLTLVGSPARVNQS